MRRSVRVLAVLLLGTAATLVAPLAAQAQGPTVSVGDATIVEGSAGTNTLAFPVTLSSPNAAKVTVAYATANGTAAAGTDYTALSGKLTWGPGTTAMVKQVKVAILPQAGAATKTFSLVLSSPTGGYALLGAVGTGTIVDTGVVSGTPTVNLGAGAVYEGDAGYTRALDIPLTLSAPLPAAAKVRLTFTAGTALGGIDYTATTGTKSIPAGATEALVKVTTYPDAGPEPDLYLYAALSSPTANVVLGQSQSVVTLLDDQDVVTPLDPSYQAVSLTASRSTTAPYPFDTFGVSVGGGTTTVAAPAGNVSSNTRVVLWPSGESPSTDQESCATWTSDVGDTDNFTQPGVALRVSTSQGVTTAVTFTQNIFGSRQVFNMHVWNTSGTPNPYQQIGQFILTGAFPTTASADPPVDMCAEAVGDVVNGCAWQAGQSPPAWGTAGFCGSATLPAGWDHAGEAGVYMGHLVASASSAFEDVTQGPPGAPTP